MPEIHRHKTAIHRGELSKPVRLALEDGLLTQENTFFDYGCGRGGDLQRLKRKGFQCEGWDPKYCPDAEKKSSEIVNFGYVLNVIENPQERVHTLQQAWSLAQNMLIVSAQHVMSANLKDAKPYKDGYLTQRSTFQKYFEQQELKAFIEQHLQVKSVPVAPGIFYVFRDESQRENYLSQRYRRQTARPRELVSDLLFTQHQVLFQTIMDFYTDRGRLPEPTEIPEGPDIVAEIGSMTKAFGILKRKTDPQHWEKIRVDRALDLIVYLALSRFEGRSKFTHLPLALQYDIKAHYSSYKNACEFADDLLFSVGNLDVLKGAFKNCKVGKMLPQELYIHISALPHLPPELRVLEGCARAFIGNIDNANIIKISRFKPKVSYLYYPDFDKDPHPRLESSLLVHLGKYYESYRDYSLYTNPPILHRKEEFVSEHYPLRERFAKLTHAEVKAGLYEQPLKIGMKQGWEEVLKEKKILFKGHRLIKI
ncbi:DNA phosphorothioation-associated methyltransferase [bacterium (Candidatus Blackallbacteria) CG17_big_fil_post_rev_8_21_14_2_50_48_46]|uniref:DNA phosphorothioation-associated methyltransferase n=1 Tax=bacterium (Candidatus Blackallbacteria) CG17_big_fil_post_rev_8_21_14_2_50_48_46 TaxID=2014261 RepID=A0A2M7G7B4_9BACT|nr:MAG: DNA phosphorothioation-associated methyltransferase [bacterium (Candidatus Blackallbacteria) CG18_big_fil_WC_8_21_14_2_50_49_26]PIW17936.1 MAG: DNA phosphorothioation-associated methyltransferase [bacterium (Candidatus Blackallbacteria) CG17_big_fil_post_rev_8_21_14_2_50_48_46]PIW45755.1 MAG: DNA phosphorothioation-associated methyltransferase [bacterium (Candidatus Blackallbacteria) CG13_big_fil_rev_8_21_14_2_50_49_14]